jgi:hypothetical protein
MRCVYDSFVKQMRVPALVAAVATFLIAGCATKPVTANLGPPIPAAAPPPALTADEMSRLIRDFPDTAHRVQLGQPMVLEDVKDMAKLGFSPDVIVSQVRISHTVFHLTASAIIDLKSSGVSEQVIDFLISTPSSIAGSNPMPEPSNLTATVQVPPPPAPAETPPPTPGPDYVWVGGDWVWNGGWVWVGGHWAYPPFVGAFWDHGVWRHGWGGYRRFRGGWRR